MSLCVSKFWIQLLHLCFYKMCSINFNVYLCFSYSNTYDSPTKAVEALREIVRNIRQKQVFLFMFFLFKLNNWNCHNFWLTLAIFIFFLKFTCQKCGSTFNEQKNLNLHNRNQHADMLPSYACPSCDSKFKAPYTLKKHLKDKHKIEMDLEIVKEFNNPIKNSKRGNNLNLLICSMK